MGTLALLAALLLLAFPARAHALRGTAEQLPAQDQPEPQDQAELLFEGQDQPGDEDQDGAITFAGEEPLAQQTPGSGRLLDCKCRRATFCNFLERSSGKCAHLGPGYKRCCR